MAKGIYIRTEQAKRNMALAKLGKRGNNTGHFYSKRIKGAVRGSPEWVAKIQSGRERFFASHPNWKAGPRGKVNRPKGAGAGIKHTFKDLEGRNKRVSEGLIRANLKGERNPINNPECSGRMESHHILNWVDYPEERYNVKNGITLCHAHHPRGRKSEQELQNLLQELVENKSLSYGK